MMSLYLVTDQYEPYMPSSHQCTGSSRRRRSKYGYQMSSWYSFGLLTSSLPRGIEFASSLASKWTGAFIAVCSLRRWPVLSGEPIATVRYRHVERVHHAAQCDIEIRDRRQLHQPLHAAPLQQRVEHWLLDTIGSH